MSSLVLLLLLFTQTEDKNNLEGLLNYFLIQVLGRALILMSILYELGIYRNFFCFKSNFRVLSQMILLLGLLFKVGVYPFYYQVVFIFLKLNGVQCFMFSTLLKVWPLLLLLIFIRQLSFYVIRLVAVVSILIAGLEGL